jgi:tetratricopeptide (TPR) repeat protein
MRRYWSAVLPVVFVLSLLIPQASQAFIFKGNVDKAREYVKANMVKNAIDLLKEEIEKNPTNAEAHFELGSIYLDQGDYNGAAQRFKGAAGIDGKYKEHIVKRYMDTGIAMMNREKNEDAKRCFDIAVSFQPALKEKIADDFMKSATTMMNQCVFEGAINRFEIAASYQPSLKPKIAEFLYNKAMEMNKTDGSQNTDSRNCEKPIKLKEKINPSKIL